MRTDYYCMVYDGDETYASDGPFNNAEDARHELTLWLSKFIDENADKFNEFEDESAREALGELLSGVQNPEYHLESDVVFVTQTFGMKLEVYKGEMFDD